MAVKGPSELFDENLALNNYSTHIPTTIRGYSLDINNASFLPLNPLNLTTVFVPSLMTVTLSSSSASDASAGVGARTVLVSGLDSLYQPQSEVLTLNGQSSVTSTLTYVAINTLSVVTAGSSGANVGNLYAGTGTVTAGVPATVFSYIYIGDNISSVAAYTCPAGFSLLGRDFFATTSGGVSPVTYSVMRQVTQGGLFYTRKFPISGTLSLVFNTPDVLPEKCSVYIMAVDGGSTDGGSFGIGGYLRSNSLADGRYLT